MIFKLWRWVGLSLGYIGNQSAAEASEDLQNGGRVEGFRLAVWALTRVRTGEVTADQARSLTATIRAWCAGRDGCGDLLGFAATVDADIAATERSGS